MQKLAIFLVIAAGLGTGCTLQGPFTPPATATPPAWTTPAVPTNGQAAQIQEDWWRLLGDPAIDKLEAQALKANATLAQALARMDEAAATLGLNQAEQGPTVKLTGALTRGKQQNTTGLTSKPTILYSSASIGPSLSWELDLFGRLRENTRAAQSRLDARTADASSARLTLTTNVADTVLSLRACQAQAEVVNAELGSRARTVQLTLLRVRAGFATELDLARTRTALASAQSNVASQEQECTKLVNALAALSGSDATQVRQWVSPLPAGSGEQVSAPEGETRLPVPPMMQPQLPATLIAQHPSVVAAMQDTQAAWADIAVARANRLPKLDLAGALTGQWISAAGYGIRYNTWSIGPQLSETLFDGGAGAANVTAAQARYRQAAAKLDEAVRSAVQDVENALAAGQAAQSALAAARDGLAGANTVLKATQAQQRAGSINQIELESAVQQQHTAQQQFVSAARDRARAWVSLVKASGAALSFVSESHPHD